MPFRLLIEDLKDHLRSGGRNSPPIHTPDPDCFSGLTDEQCDAIYRWHTQERLTLLEQAQDRIAEVEKKARFSDKVSGHATLLAMIPFAMDYTLRRYLPIETFMDVLHVAYTFVLAWAAHFMIFALFAGPYHSVFEDKPYTPLRRIFAFLIAIALSTIVFSCFRL